MIDIHSHIIFDIDDGAEDIDTSVELCRQAFENGFDGIVATPHFNDYRHIDRFVMERDAKLFQLREILKREEINITLYEGCELFLNNSIFTAGDLDPLTINGSRYMLCEFPLGPFNVLDGLDQIVELTDRGYTPIVAHPERYPEVHKNPELINRLLRRGVIFQVNVDSVVGNLGKLPQEISIDLLLGGFAKLIGSDAHDISRRNMNFGEKFSCVPSVLTREILIDCFGKYPEAVINDEDILE